MNPLSGVLGEAWKLYRAHAAHLMVIAFVIYLVAAVVAAVFALAGGFFGALLGSIVELFAAFLVQAALVKAVQDVRDGRADLSFGETVSAATPYLGPVAGASILAGIAITVGLILLIVPGLYLITIWAVIVPVIVIERSGALASFGRSQQLVRGRGWHVFGTLVLVFLILIVVDILLGRLGNPYRPVPRPCGDADLLPALRCERRAGSGNRQPRGRLRDGVRKAAREGHRGLRQHP